MNICLCRDIAVSQLPPACSISPACRSSSTTRTLCQNGSSWKFSITYLDLSLRGIFLKSSLGNRRGVRFGCSVHGTVTIANARTHGRAFPPPKPAPPRRRTPRPGDPGPPPAPPISPPPSSARTEFPSLPCVKYIIVWLGIAPGGGACGVPSCRCRANETGKRPHSPSRGAPGPQKDPAESLGHNSVPSLEVKICRSAAEGEAGCLLLSTPVFNDATSSRHTPPNLTHNHAGALRARASPRSPGHAATLPAQSRPGPPPVPPNPPACGAGNFPAFLPFFFPSFLPI